MIKNISVNLFGTLYNIDEDAYQLLQQYEDSVRNYFKRKGDDDEVAQDIERRVAELCEELRQQGVGAITVEHVRDIIRRIGQPGEMDGQNEVQAGDTEAETVDADHKQPDAEAKSKTEEKNAPRKLFRDPDDCMLGGVLSGLAHYIGGSATALRLLVVILGLFVASIPWLIVCYLVACVLIPKAVTPEDKLRMMGKPVNLLNLGEGVINSVGESVKAGKPQGCLNQMLSLIAVMFKIAVFVCGGMVAAIVGIILFCILCVALITLAASISSFSLGDSALWFFDLDVPAEFISRFTNTSFWLTIVAMVLACGIPLYCILHLYRRFRDKERPWSSVVVVAVSLLWLLCVGLVVAFGHSAWVGVRDSIYIYNNNPGGMVDFSEPDGEEPIDDSDAELEAVSSSLDE